jgi:hypothetical protein
MRWPAFSASEGARHSGEVHEFFNRELGRGFLGLGVRGRISEQQWSWHAIPVFERWVGLRQLRSGWNKRGQAHDNLLSKKWVGMGWGGLTCQNRTDDRRDHNPALYH